MGSRGTAQPHGHVRLQVNFRSVMHFRVETIDLFFWQNIQMTFTIRYRYRHTEGKQKTCIKKAEKTSSASLQSTIDDAKEQ